MTENGSAMTGQKVLRAVWRISPWALLALMASTAGTADGWYQGFAIAGP